MTPLLPTPDMYLQNLLAMKSSDAKRLHRKAIIEHFDSTCVYCGVRHESHQLTLDHIRPRCRGGNSFTSNLVPSCQKCNQSKGSNNWLSWMRDTFGYRPDKEQLILSWIK